MGFVAEPIRPANPSDTVVNDADIEAVPFDPNAVPPGPTRLNQLASNLNARVDQIAEDEPRARISTGFVTFGGPGVLVLSNLNLQTYAGISAVYQSPINQGKVVQLPTDQNIIDAPNVSFPNVVLEFIHLGGDSTGSDNQLVITVPGEPSPEHLIETTSQPTGVNQVVLSRGNVLQLTKADADSNWVANRHTIDPADTLLPTGIFTFRTGVVISDITQINTAPPTGLLGISPQINMGDAFLVQGGGTYFGTTVNAGDVIVADEDNPSLLITSTDWLILRNTNNSGSLGAETALILAHFMRDGSRVNADENFFVDKSNVIVEQISATILAGRFRRRIVLLDQGSGGGTEQTLSLDIAPGDLNFADIFDGSLITVVRVEEAQVSGAEPEFLRLEIDYGQGLPAFVIPLTIVDESGGTFTISTPIETLDYSPIFNRDPVSVMLVADFRGLNYTGYIEIVSITARRVGTLHDSIVQIAEDEANNVRGELEGEINGLRNGADGRDDSIAELAQRVSPRRTVRRELISTSSALFFNIGTGVGVPVDLNGFTRGDARTNRFLSTDDDLLIAVPADRMWDLSLVDAEGVRIGELIALSTDGVRNEPAFSLVASREHVGISYFIFRFTNSTTSRVAIYHGVENEVLSWDADIQELLTRMRAVEVILEHHQLLNLTDDVVSWLLNDLTITRQTAANTVPSSANLALRDDATQAVYFEQLQELSQVPGEFRTNRINQPAIPLINGAKIFYMPLGGHNDGDIILEARRTSFNQPLVRRRDNRVVAIEFVEAVTGSSRNVTRFLNTDSNVHTGEGFVRLSLHDSNFNPESNEVVYTRELPEAPATVRVYVREITNGRTEPETVTTIDNVGGGAGVERSVDLQFVSDNAVVQLDLRWVPGSRPQFIVRLSPQSSRFIGDAEVRAEWTQVIVTPATAATTREVDMGAYVDNQEFVMMVGTDNPARQPGDQDRLIWATRTAHGSFNRLFNTIFQNDDSGELIYFRPNGILPTVYDYRGLELSQTNAQRFDDLKTLPFKGMFTIDHDEESVMTSDTQISAVDSKENQFTLGTDLILTAPDGGGHRLTVNNDGDLITEKV